jgi:hypothetical protein
VTSAFGNSTDLRAMLLRDAASGTAVPDPPPRTDTQHANEDPQAYSTIILPLMPSAEWKVCVHFRR